MKTREFGRIIVDFSVCIRLAFQLLYMILVGFVAYGLTINVVRPIMSHSDEESAKRRQTPALHFCLSPRLLSF